MGTVWYRLDGSDWIFNHLAYGVEDGLRPRPSDQYYGGPPIEEQARAWAKGKWRREYVWIDDDGNLTPWKKMLDE